jgi:hypothetical protein
MLPDRGRRYRGERPGALAQRRRDVVAFIRRAVVRSRARLRSRTVRGARPTIRGKEHAAANGRE